MRAASDQIPDIVSEREPLYRYVYSPSMVRNGMLMPAAFELRNLPSGDRESYVSFTRSDYAPAPLPKNAPKRKESVLGYILLTFLDVKTVENEVITPQIIAAKTKSNPAHAGLQYFYNGELIVGADGEFHDENYEEYLRELSLLDVYHTFI